MDPQGSYDALCDCTSSLAASVLDGDPIASDACRDLRNAVDEAVAASMKSSASAVAREVIYAMGLFLAAGDRANAEHCRRIAIRLVPKAEARAALEKASSWPEWLLLACRCAWMNALDRDVEKADEMELDAVARHSDPDVQAFISGTSW
jgi:hypothetical protein